MNNRFVDAWWLHGIGVLLAVALLSGGAAYASPHEAGEAVRGTGKSGTEVTRLVHGDPKQINAVVAGFRPTAILAVTPVNPPPGLPPYPVGVTIVGNELRIDRYNKDGFRAWFNVQVSDWDPAGDGPNALTFQVKIDCSGYYHSDCLDLDPDTGLDGLDLIPASVACANNAACVTAFGEDWASCDTVRGICIPGYLDADGTGRPDSFCAAPEGCIVTGVAQGTCNFTYFAAIGSRLGIADGGLTYYGGTLVLDFPGGAKGKYTVQLNRDETFLAVTGDQGVTLDILVKSGFVVNFVTGSCCHNLGTPLAGCIDQCVNRSDCETEANRPFVFTPSTEFRTALCDNKPTADGCERFLGACCDALVGQCDEEILEADCQGPHRVWTSGTSCGDAACIADTGACCNHDPFGPCTDDAVLSDCRCATCTWHKLQACAEIECASIPIPTVSEWGLAILTLLLLTGAKILFARTHVHGSEHRAQAR